MFDRSEEEPRRPSLGDWIAQLSSIRLIGYGFLIILIASALTMVCGGAFSLALRPVLLERTATPTLAPTATRAPSPTLAPATFINLPTGRPPATPTQGRIPTREPTQTPTVNGDLTGVPITATITITATRGSPSPTNRASATPTRRTTGTTTPRP